MRWVRADDEVRFIIIFIKNGKVLVSGTYLSHNYDDIKTL